MFRLDESIALGRHLLAEVRPLAGESSTIWMRRIATWVDANPAHPYAHVLARKLSHPMECVDLGWTVAWAMSAFQRVQMGHKLAASLMATNPGDDPEVTECKPWDAYTIEMPPDLVRVGVAGRTVSYDTVAVWHHPPDAMSWFIVLSRNSDAALGGKLEFPLPELGDIGELTLSEDETSQAERARDCFARLVITTQLEMSDPDLVRRPSIPRPAKATTTAPSGVHRLIREVTIDCREAVADYVSGRRRSSASVRTLVRGHSQRYAVGKGRVERRWINKEPYWKGEPGAPVAVRPHRFPEGGP